MAVPFRGQDGADVQQGADAQPEPFDIVGDNVMIAGTGIAFEATLNIIIRGETGAVVTHTFFMTNGGDI